MSLPDRTGGGGALVRGISLSLIGRRTRTEGRSASASVKPVRTVSEGDEDTHLEEPKTALSAPLEEEETTMRR